MHRAEMVADFQQHYGLDALSLGLDADDGEHVRASMLVSQLPSSSRLVVADDPDMAWDASTQILRIIEFDLRCLAYGLGGKKGQRPEPLKMPSESAHESKESLEQDMEDVKAVLHDLISPGKEASDG